MKFNKTALVAAAGAAAVPVLAATPSHAALSSAAAAMVTSAEAAFVDLTGAVASMAAANMGLVIGLVVASMIIGYLYKAGRG